MLDDFETRSDSAKAGALIEVTTASGVRLSQAASHLYAFVNRPAIGSAL